MSETRSVLANKGRIIGGAASSSGEVPTIEYEDWIKLSEEEKVQKGFVEVAHVPDTLTLEELNAQFNLLATGVTNAQGRNLISFPYFSSMISTNNGVTFTVNNDGSITANGTATANAYFWVANNKYIEKNSYTLSGCPKDGGNSKYAVGIRFQKNNTNVKDFRDYGNGNSFENSSIDYDDYDIYILIVNGQTVDNLVFNPMFEVGNVAHQYEPTTESNATLKNEVISLNQSLAEFKHGYITNCNEFAGFDAPFKIGYYNTSTSNTPNYNTYGVIICYGDSSVEWYQQTATETISGETYARIYSNGAWTDWHKLLN